MQSVSQQLYSFESNNRASPSGKAPVFGTGIRGFESLIPSQQNSLSFMTGFFVVLSLGFTLRSPVGFGSPLARKGNVHKSNFLICAQGESVMTLNLIKV